jgi:hypothetical protein
MTEKPVSVQCWIRIHFETIALGGSETRSKTFEHPDGSDVTDGVFSLTITLL